ncbi:MAG TPA: histidine kinase dimerization/phospho-acceptor domain-containing protein, partial [Catenuloplanes sp.]
MSWSRRLSLRARLMLIGVAGLTVGLAVGGMVLVTALNVALVRTADEEARTAAQVLAGMVDQTAVDPNALPNPLPAGTGLGAQVVDAEGRVRARSLDMDPLVSMLYPAELARVAPGTAVPIPGSRIGWTAAVRVVALPAGPAHDRQTVLVARATGDLSRGVALLRNTMVIVFPLLLALLAAVAWRVIGATLRPVEALRRGAEEITGGARRGQLPVPASHDEIHRLAVTLNGMLDRLDAARARQRAFVADAAHELRSPLTNMRTELEVAQRLADRTDWPALAGDLLIDVQRLGRLVDDLLLLARADASDARAGDVAAGGRPGRAAEPVELGALLATAAQRCPSPPVRLVAPDTELWTRGEPDALVRAVGNLLDNAVRHATSQVVVTVGP